MKKQKMDIAKFTAVFDPAEEGGFVVTVPSLPGCITEGDSLEEAVKMAKDAILAYLKSMKRNKENLPQNTSASFVGTIDVPISALA